MEVYWKKHSGSYSPENDWETTEDLNGILVSSICIGSGIDDQLGVVALPAGNFTTVRLSVLRHKETIEKKKYE